MLRKIWVFLASAQCVMMSAMAQDETASDRKSSHYFGLQMNQLIRQVFNFSGTNPSVNNPYLLTWAVNANETGVGFATGFGYNFSETSNGDQFIEHITTINNLFFRMGLEKKSTFAKKVLVSIGGDIVLDREKSEIETKERTQSQINFGNTTINTGIGIGPRLGLNYMLTDKILIGTEANYYFKSIKVKLIQTNVFFETVFDPATGHSRQVRRTEETSTEEKNKRFQFNSPTIIFLIMKL